METDFYLRPLLALSFVIGMIFVAGAILRRISPVRSFFGKPAMPRLEIVERLGLDTRRQLVLIRYNDREHLVLLGQNNDLLIDAHPAGPRFVATGQTSIQRPMLPDPSPPEPEPEPQR